MTIALTRRALLDGIAGAVSTAVVGCGNAAGTVRAPEQTLAAPLKLARALGPWRDERADALAARLSHHKALAHLDPRIVDALAAGLPDGAYALDRLPLADLDEAHRAALTAWLEAVSHDDAVLAHLWGMGVPGECDGDLTRSTSPPRL